MKRNTGNGCGSRNKTNKPFGEERAEMDLKWITQMAERVHELEDENKRLKGLLEECENKREPDMTKPQPCTKFCDAKITAWIAKLSEETNEVVQEAENYEMVCKNAAAGTGDVLEAKDRLAEELTDVITVCVSWLHALGYDEYMRGEVQKRVNEKNKDRGYF